MATLIIILVIVGVIAYFRLSGDPKAIKLLYKDKTPDQKTVIRYFTVEGCLKKKVTDATFDEILAKNNPDLKERAMAKIGLDEDELKEIDPVCYTGFIFDNDAYSKLGEDNKWRSSKWQVSWLFFSSTQVYLYQRTISLDEKKEKERTEEFFYKDIVNFSTLSESKEVKVWVKGLEQRKQVDTTELKIVVPGDSFYCAIRTVDDTVERSVQGMKAKLREKKNA